jgi:hypothetical protein
VTLDAEEDSQFRRGYLVLGGDKLRTLPRSLEEVKWYVVLGGKESRVRWMRTIPVYHRNRYVGIDENCTVTSVGRVPKLRERD